MQVEKPCWKHVVICPTRIIKSCVLLGVCTYSSDIAARRANQKQRDIHMAEQQPADHWAYVHLSLWFERKPTSTLVNLISSCISYIPHEMYVYIKIILLLLLLLLLLPNFMTNSAVRAVAFNSGRAAAPNMYTTTWRMGISESQE